MTGKRTLTVGLVGYKFMGKAHSNAWRQAPRFLDLSTHVRLRAICGRDAKTVREVAGKFDWETAATNWRAVVDDPEIDICTPNDSHAEIAIAAAKAGKAVLCEKPLARNVAEAEKNDTCSEASACRQHDLSQLSPHSGDRLGQANDQAGRTGRSHFSFQCSLCAGLDYRSKLSARLAFAIGRCRLRRARPVKTGARQKGKVAVDDAVTIAGRFENGALASLEAHPMQRRDALRLVLGELGRHGGHPSSQLSKMVSKINVC